MTVQGVLAAINWNVVTAVVAVLAFALSLLNTWTNWRQSGPRFKVEAKASMLDNLHIRVRNTSNYPVTVERFFLTRREFAKKGPGYRVAFDVAEKEGLPRTIAPWAAAEFACPIKDIQQAINAGNDVVCVQTADGRSGHSRPDLSFRLAARHE